MALPALLALALLALTAGCVAPRRELPPGAIALDVAAVRQQEPSACGAATIEALTGYYGVPLSDDTRRDIAARTSAETGLAGSDLCAALEAAGLETFLFRGTLDRTPTGLWHQLDNGRPLVVAINSAEDRNHYVLLVGYDPRTEDVAVLDPAQGRLVLPAERFRDCWERAERFTLLALPREPTASQTPTASMTQETLP